MSRSELAWRRQPEAAVPQSIDHRKDNKGARYLFRAPFINRLKFYRVPQPEIFWERVYLNQDNPT